VLLSADDIKALLEEYNATLPAPVPMGAAWKKLLRATWRCQLSSSVSRQIRSKPPQL
jgi:hypothetical protein